MLVWQDEHDTLRNAGNVEQAFVILGDMIVRQFEHGQSNPTYYIKCGDTELVLRKKPVCESSIVHISNWLFWIQALVLNIF